jgi:HAD superfamily hydrolase (TIGR01458 family)
MNPGPPLLIDFDGIIKVGNTTPPDAGDFLEYITTNNIPAIIISNSTLYSGTHITEFLQGHGISFNIPCITAIDASLEYIKKNNLKIKSFCDNSVKSLFSEYETEEPDIVLIGDLGSKWSYEILNDIFRYVYNGAGIIAMQKNKFWKPEGELCLDAGAFIAAIEYASEKKALLIGKPSPLYFEMALHIIGYNLTSGFIMIGDDIDNDIQAAQNLNGKGVLLYTGKTKYPLESNSKVKPDFEAFNLSDVIKFLKPI